jgi:hypothetical protein
MRDYYQEGGKVIKKNYRRKNIIAIMSILSLISLLAVGCCPGYGYLQKGEKAETFTITGAEYEGAFSKAMKAAGEIGFHVSNFDRSVGSFHARRGAGFTEVTEMEVSLEKDAPGKLTLVLKIKTSKNYDKFVKEFLEAYGRYVKIIPYETNPPN